jgi:hypothetical protein
LSRRQARWAEILSQFDFTIKHLDGKKNPADGPSRRPDYEIGYERPSMALLAAATVLNYSKDLTEQIKLCQGEDKLARDVIDKLNLTSNLASDSPPIEDQSTSESQRWKVIAGALTYERRIYVPDDRTTK